MMKFDEQFEMNVGAKEMMEAASEQWEELHRLILEEAWIVEKEKSRD